MVYSDATLALKALSDGACDVVAGSLFHNLTVGLYLGRMTRHVVQLLSELCSSGCSSCDLCDIV